MYRNTDAAADGEWSAVLSEPNMGRTSIAVAPSNPDVVYALSASNVSEPGGFNQGLLAVFRSSEAGAAGTWKAVVRNTASDRLSTLLLTNPIIAAEVSAIAVSGPRVLAGTSDGFIYRNDHARSATSTTVWAGVQLREGFVSSITHHPGNADIVYATFAGFGGQHVWKSTNGGVSWAPLDGEGDGQIPDIPVHHSWSIRCVRNVFSSARISV